MYVATLLSQDQHSILIAEQSMDEALRRNVFFFIYSPPSSWSDLLVTGPCLHGQLNELCVNVFLVPILLTSIQATASFIIMQQVVGDSRTTS